MKSEDTNLVPICLPNITEVDLGLTQYVITGWGRMKDDDRYSDVLQEAVVPIVNSTDCFQILGFRIDVNTDICASGLKEGVLGTCIGDSGGPLQCQHNNKQCMANDISLLSLLGAHPVLIQEYLMSSQKSTNITIGSKK